MYSRAWGEDASLLLLGGLRESDVKAFRFRRLAVFSSLILPREKVKANGPQPAAAAAAKSRRSNARARDALCYGEGEVVIVVAS